MQIRPRKVTANPTDPPAAPIAPRSARVPGVSGVRVDGRAARSVSSALNDAGLARLRDAAGDRALSEALADIGRKGLAQAARDAGLARSRSTIARWARHGIPKQHAARVTELVARRALIGRAGGVDAAAEQIGSSPAAVSRWQSGHTARMTGTRAAGLRQLEADDARTRAGIPPGARVKIRATVTLEYRAGGHTSDDYRTDRNLTFPTDGYLSQAVTDELAAALAAGDDGLVIALAEAAISEDFDLDYSDADGAHIVELRALGLDIS